MALIKQHCEFFDEEVELRYDQYRRTDTQEHRNELSAAAAAVINEASRKKLSLSFTTANLDPDPHWCEQTVALVSLYSAATELLLTVGDMSFRLCCRT